MARQRRRIEIYDTTLRDGTQSEGVSLSVQDRLLILEALDALGVDYIEGGFPLSNPKDAEFFNTARNVSLAHAKLSAFGMTRRKDTAAEADTGLAALVAAETPVVALVGKTWSLHVSDVLNASPDENLAMIGESVAFLIGRGREVFFDAEHFFDGYRADARYALACLRAAADAGASRLVLCDTNGGSTLEHVAQVIKAVVDLMPEAMLGIHCHNDCHLAVANSLTAVRHGVMQVQGTINGVGERCGNADLTGVIGNLATKYDVDCLRPGTLGSLTKVSRFVYEVANLNFLESQPFVGAAAFAHKGGMHVHAMRRNVKTYEHIDPAVVGNSRRILVSELAGVSNIEAVAPAKFGLRGDKDAQRRVLNVLMEMEKAGYQFEAARASFEVLIRKTLGGKWYRTLWDLDHYRCVLFKQTARTPNIEAIVRLRVNDSDRHTVSAGDGPVDSLDRALCEALRPHYPQVDDLHLVDYKVRVVNTAAETAARVRVLIDWYDVAREAYFGSVGVSENIIEASWLALVDAIEYTILNAMDASSAGEAQ